MLLLPFVRLITERTFLLRVGTGHKLRNTLSILRQELFVRMTSTKTIAVLDVSELKDGQL